MIPAAILATAGTALVTAMTTDGWEGVRKKVAQWFGRGKKDDTDRALTELDQSRAALAALAAATGAELDRTRTEQEIVWRTRMGDLASRDEGAAAELPALVRELQALTSTVAGRIEQHATASGNAQQAVLGQGVQTNTFGGQGGTS
jgi:hypothetical protein